MMDVKERKTVDRERGKESEQMREMERSILNDGHGLYLRKYSHW